jgi:predicted amidohydrolase
MIYASSVAKSENGVDKAEQHYPVIAGKYAMTVLMANCVGHCDNFQSAGKSAIWNDKGNLAGQLNDKNEGLLIFDTAAEEMIKKILYE